MTIEEITRGAKLENGATVIEFQETWDGGVVLAQFEDEFVTWRVNEAGETFWGHYFSSIAEAAADYADRTAQGRNS